MNLFVTSTDPTLCAHYLDDKRIGKLLMEANQMMSMAIKTHWHEGDDSYVFWETPTELTSGWGHRNHPVSVWVRQSLDNFMWTLEYARALDAEFQFRFGHRHASGNRINFLAAHSFCLPPGPVLPFQNSARHEGLGLDFTHLPVPLSYREYIQARWKTDKRPVTFTRRGAPEWSQQQ